MYAVYREPSRHPFEILCGMRRMTKTDERRACKPSITSAIRKDGNARWLSPKEKINHNLRRRLS